MFPILYHAHHSLHPEDIPFWKDLAARCGDPILELGCGTGRLLLPLAEAGHRITGLDRDAQMLAFLKDRLSPEQSALACIFQADMTAFCLAARFALIVLPCNTLSTLDPAERRQMFANVAGHLQPGGVFAASLPNPILLRRMRRRSEAEVEEIFPHPLDGEPVQVSSAWRRTEEYFVLEWHYDHLLSDGRVERTSARAAHRLDLPHIYEDELLGAGLALQARYGDFDASAYAPSSPNLILVASKPLAGG